MTIMGADAKTASLYGEIFNWIDDAEFLKKSAGYISRINIDKTWFNGKRCLDAGCGTGIAARGLASLSGTRVYLFDLSKECLEMASARLKGNGNFSIMAASAVNIPFKDRTFDFVNCNGVLHHISDTGTAIAEIYRVLKPGGRLFIGVYGRGGILNEWKIRFGRVLARMIPYSVMRRVASGNRNYELLDNLYVPIRKAYSEEAIMSMLRVAGLRNINRIEGSFYRRPRNLRERLAMGRDGMYMHFSAER